MSEIVTAESTGKEQDCKDAAAPTKEDEDCKDAAAPTKENNDCKDASAPTKAESTGKEQDCKDAAAPTKESNDCKDAAAPTKENNDCKDAAAPEKENKDCKDVAAPTKENTDRKDAAAPTKGKKDHKVTADDIKFGRFLHPGAEPLGYEHQDYVLIEGGNLHDRSLLSHILDAWELEPPNLLICLVGGWDHPFRFLDLRAEGGDMDKPTLQGIIEKAMEALNILHGKERGSENFDTAKDLHKLEHNLGHELFDNVVHIAKALLDACAETNSWLVVDAEQNMGQLMMIIEHALLKTEARPVIIDFLDYVSHKRWDKTDATHEAWEQIKSGAKPLPKTGGNVKDLPVLRLSPQIYPETSWSKLWPCDGEDETTRSVHKHPYGKWVFRGASHYVFSHCTQGVTDYYQCKTHICFPAEWLGPLGNVFSAGLMKKGDRYAINMIYKSLIDGKPTMLFKHTGKGTDFWSHLLQIIFQGDFHKGTKSAADVIADLQKQVPKLIDKIEDKDSLYVWLAALQKESLQRLKACTVIVDPYEDTPDQVLDKLSNAFTSGKGGTLGLREAHIEDEEVINIAWQQWILFDENCKHFGRHANHMMVGGLVLSFLATVVSQLTSFVDTEVGTSGAWAQELQQMPLWRLATMMVVTFPALAGLLTTMLSRLRYVQKWGALYMARELTESEIYCFRAHALDYDLSQSISVGSSEKQKQATKDKTDGGSKKRAGKRGSKVFADKISDIFHAVVVGEIQEDGLAYPEKFDAVCKKQSDHLETTRHGLLFKRATSTKRDHYSSHQPASAPQGSARNSRVSQLSEPLLGSVPPSEIHTITVYDVATPSDLQQVNALDRTGHVPEVMKGKGDDLISTLSTEEYYTYRVLPRLTYYREQAVAVAWKIKCYEILGLVASLAGTLCGALQLTELIPIALALGAGMASLLQYEGLQARIVAINAAIDDLTGLERHWATYGVVEKKTRSVVRHIVDITEKAILREARAYTGELQASKARKQKTDECDKKPEGKKASKGQER